MLLVILCAVIIIDYFNDYHINNSKVEAEQYLYEFYDKNYKSTLSTINDLNSVSI